MDDGVAFVIDRHDDIVEVNDAWTRFAVDNDAPELAADHVLRRHLWDFIVDATTRYLYAELLLRVRGGSTARFPLRCDSPRLRRRLEMTVRPAGADLVRFESVLVSAEPRTDLRLWGRHERRSSSRMLRTCSWCKRVDVAGRWTEIENALEQLALFEGGDMPLLTHGMCETCQRMIEAAITQLDRQKIDPQAT